MKTCSFGDCDRPRLSRDLCSAHHQQQKRGKPLGPIRAYAPGSQCSFHECDRAHAYRGYCEGHAKQLSDGRELKPLARRYKKGEVCAFKGCNNLKRANDLCGGHNQQRGQGKPLIPLLPPSAPSGSGHVSKYGYRIVRWNGRSLPEHRMIMEIHLGRRLVPGENVHHINGDRLDNRLENLQLWNTSQPAGQRVEDKVAWAKEILAQYDPDALKENP